MLFNSFHFLVFFPVVVMIYFIFPKKVRWIWLLLASYYFYMSWNVKYALLIACSTAITWCSGLLLQKFKCRLRIKKIIVALCCISNLAILFYFKYFQFAVENINKLLSGTNIRLLNNAHDIILPVGISFYTFQALSYTIDVYREEIDFEPNILKYALFVSFFPQLVAGPIERSKNLLTQIRRPTSFCYERLREGLIYMGYGYFMKLVMADKISIVVDTVYGNIEAYPGWFLICATILFAFQIYGDFGGYSLIAIGAARILGFDLMENFRAPYFSQSISEFWRRWHISLSTWFRDYIYIPLGGNRRSSIRKYFNLLVVFITSGLWHGASWHFVAWGGGKWTFSNNR